MRSQNNERLLANFATDAHVNPTVREVGEPYYRHWERMRDVLAAAWEASDGQRHVLEAALDLALDFQTWSTLVRRGEIGGERAVERNGLQLAVIFDEFRRETQHHRREPPGCSTSK